MNHSLSETFKQLRFPLAFLIVLKHYYTPDISAGYFETATGMNYTVYGFIGDFTAHVCTAIVVPLFFFMSGYLYFVNVHFENGGGYFLSAWKKKTKNRLKSLLIPYISWNAIVLLLFYVTQTLTNNASEIQKDGYLLIADYQFTDYLKAFWAIDSTGFPIDGPLWFIRDLFITSVLLTPIIYSGIKCLKWFFIFIVALCYFMHWGIPIAGFSTACLFYFSLGAYCSLHKKDLGVDCSKQTFAVCGISMLSSLCLFTVAYYLRLEIKPLTHELYKIICVTCMFAWLGRYVKQGKLILFGVLSSTSFFIFAIHKPLQVIVRRCSFLFVNPTDQFLLSLMVFVIPLVVTAISIGIYYFIKRYMPYMKFLNGYRL